MKPSLNSRPADWLSPLNEPVVSVGGSSDGARAAALGSEGTATILDATDGRVGQRWSAHEGGGFRLAWHPERDLLATSGADGKVRWWDPATAALQLEIPGGSAWVEQLEWSPDGRYLAIAAGRQLTLLNADGTVAHVCRNHPSTLAALCWRSDSAQVAVACYGGIYLYEPATGQLKETLLWKSSLLSLAWAPDHRWIAAGTQECSIQIWPLPFKAGGELAMSGYEGKVRELAWHHSGRYLATGGSDQIMVWDCSGNGPSGTTPRILAGHDGRVTALAYQVRGHLLASGDAEGQVRFWNARQPVTLREIQLSGSITALAWARNEQSVVAGTHDGVIALAKAPTS